METLLVACEESFAEVIDMNNPLISVIVPVYNVEKYLPERVPVKGRTKVLPDLYATPVYRLKLRI